MKETPPGSTTRKRTLHNTSKVTRIGIDPVITDYSDGKILNNGTNHTTHTRTHTHTHTHRASYI